MTVFDLAQCDRLSKTALKGQIDHPAFAIVGVWTGMGGDRRQADDGGLTSAVIDQNFIPRSHRLDGAQRLWVAHPIPNGRFVAFKLIDGIFFRIGLGKKIGHMGVLFQLIARCLRIYSVVVMITDRTTSHGEHSTSSYTM